ncbi:MAG: DUF433 domain-containing protein [Acidobacteria bacterium]|nr:DUF433 domain-containing protein [Acidobacteriota bacterium]MBI3426312.1 DUF433 domain-containing protein [Acidobacteriota bacterium]
MGTHKKGKSSEAVRLGLPLLKRVYDGEEIEYYPLGKYIVIQPQCCGGRPTVLNTRITAEGIMDLLSAGYSVWQVATRFGLPLAAIKEAAALAQQYDYAQSFA